MASDFFSPSAGSGAHGAPRTPPSGRNDAKPLIFVIDDEPVAHAFVRAALLAVGLDADVRSVFTGEDALAQLLPSGDASPAVCPDVVVLDLQLPGADGIAVLRLLRAMPMTSTLPILVHTGSEDPRMLAEAFRHGADAVISKTVDAREYYRRLGSSVLKCLAEREPHSSPAHAQYHEKAE